MIKVSVIVPVYNVELYLHRCIDSILSQTFKNFELILVDDGSTDNSGVICDEYQSKNDQITVIHQKNAGVSAARNKGLLLATGEYITFVDSDDWIEKRFLEAAYEQCQVHNLDIYASGCYIVSNEEDNKKDMSIPGCMMVFERTLSCSEKQLLLEQNYTSGPCGKLYKRQFINNITFDQTMCFGEDLKFVYSLLKQPCSFLASSDQFYYYFKNSGSITVCVNVRKCCSIRKTYLFLFRDCESMESVGKDTYSEFLYSRMWWDYDSTFKQILVGSYGLLKRYRMLRCLLRGKKIKQSLSKATGRNSWYSFYPLYILYQYKNNTPRVNKGKHFFKRVKRKIREVTERLIKHK